MSPSGAEVIRNIKSQVDEVDPSEVHGELSRNGDRAVVIVDVRESGEWDAGHIPGAVHVPRGYLESRIEGAVRDRDAEIVLYCASGQRSALAAHTLTELLGYEHVRSMTGGFTLWKDRGYEVEVPRKLTPEQREAYVKEKAKERAAVQDEIKKLAAARDAYVKAEAAKQGLDGDKAFDKAVRETLAKQAKEKGFTFEEK